VSTQANIVSAVARRGYLDGWSSEELLARQVVKLAEELGELAVSIASDDPRLAFLLHQISTVGGMARVVFQDRSCFVGADLDSAAAASELADCAVVLAVAAHALNEPDVMYTAMLKAQADVARGVR
jgi:NTP pyrophosphatase (non-canonical NTP hydrolase)